MRRGGAARDLRAEAGEIADPRGRFRARRRRAVMTDRQRALQLLRRIERESSFAAPLLAHDTGFVRTLVLGVLRWRSRLDYAIDFLARRQIEPEIRDVLRAGAYQLAYMDVAQYAAVAETVELAPKRARGF